MYSCCLSHINKASFAVGGVENCACFERIHLFNLIEDHILGRSSHLPQDTSRSASSDLGVLGKQMNGRLGSCPSTGNILEGTPWKRNL